MLQGKGIIDLQRIIESYELSQEQPFLDRKFDETFGLVPSRIDYAIAKRYLERRGYLSKRANL